MSLVLPFVPHVNRQFVLTALLVTSNTKTFAVLRPVKPATWKSAGLAKTLISWLVEVASIVPNPALAAKTEFVKGV